MAASRGGALAHAVHLGIMSHRLTNVPRHPGAGSRKGTAAGGSLTQRLANMTSGTDAGIGDI